MIMSVFKCPGDKGNNFTAATKIQLKHFPGAMFRYQAPPLGRAIHLDLGQNVCSGRSVTPRGSWIAAFATIITNASIAPIQVGINRFQLIIIVLIRMLVRESLKHLELWRVLFKAPRETLSAGCGLFSGCFRRYCVGDTSDGIHIRY